jgi:hypothetical protein
MQKMKLTEAKLKQMIKEMMTTGRLLHNGKPSLSENGRKIEDMLMSKKGELINQAEFLLDTISSTLDPLEADWLDALAKAAIATATLKRLSREEQARQRAKPMQIQSQEDRREYEQTWAGATDDFRRAYDRIRQIVSEPEARRIHRNFQGIVA